MFEVLMYLFENYMDGSVALNADQDTIVSELEQAGFSRSEIGRASRLAGWLKPVQETVQSGPQFTPHAIRHYSPEESERLGMEGKGFLTLSGTVEHFRPNDPEIVIDRMMALDSAKWIWGALNGWF